MSKQFQKIHKLLINDGYIPSFIDLNNYDNDIGEFDVVYSYITLNEHYKNETPDIIFRCSPKDSFFNYLLNSSIIDDKIFLHLDVYEFCINDTKFNYRDNKNECYDVCDNYTSSYESYNRIESKKITEFIPLYNLNNNYTFESLHKIEKFTNCIKEFQKNYGELLKKYGFFDSHITLGTSDESAIGCIEYQALFDAYNIMLIYNILNDKIYLEYLNSSGRTGRIKQIDIEKLSYDFLESLLKKLNKSHIISDQVDCLNHPDDPVKPQNLTYVLCVLQLLSYNRDLNDLAEIYWNIIPHNPSMKKFLHNILSSKQIKLISDPYFH